MGRVKKVKSTRKKQNTSLPPPAPIKCLENRYAGQAIFDLIISFTDDRSTLFAWQLVSRRCYNAATPQLYGQHIHFKRKHRFAHFFIGIFPMSSPSPSGDPQDLAMISKTEALKLVKSLSTDTFLKRELPAPIISVSQDATVSKYMGSRYSCVELRLVTNIPWDRYDYYSKPGEDKVQYTDRTAWQLRVFAGVFLQPAIVHRGTYEREITFPSPEDFPFKVKPERVRNDSDD